MEAMCFSHFECGIYTVGYTMFDMKVDIEKRCTVKSNPHLKIFTARFDYLEQGQQTMLNYLMASDINKPLYCDPGINILPVPDEDFETAFKEYVKK